MIVRCAYDLILIEFTFINLNFKIDHSVLAAVVTEIEAASVAVIEIVVSVIVRAAEVVVASEVVHAAVAEVFSIFKSQKNLKLNLLF